MTEAQSIRRRVDQTASDKFTILPIFPSATFLTKSLKAVKSSAINQSSCAT